MSGFAVIGPISVSSSDLSPDGRVNHGDLQLLQYIDMQAQRLLSERTLVLSIMQYHRLV